MEHRLAALDLEYASPKEIASIIRIIESEVSSGSLADSDICYAAYAANAVQDPKPLKGVWTKALEKYRELLLQWFSYALMNRAKLPGTSATIKEVGKELTKFVKELPDAILSGNPPTINLPQKASQFLDLSRLKDISQKITRTLIQETAGKPGLWKLEAKKHGDVPVKYYRQWKLWYIPASTHSRWAYQHREDLKRYGFKFNPTLSQWVIESRVPPPKVIEDFDVEGYQGDLTQPPSKEELKDWFFKKWLPENTNRFEKAFDYIANPESFKRPVFQVKRGGNVEVKLKMSVKNVWDAIEILRTRYLGRSGRDPWLEVIDEFIKLHHTTGPASKLSLIIDRMNNLEHSNGMFMELFPGSVKSWYGKFLNAKYHSPTASDLARYMKDPDLRELIRWFDQRQVKRELPPAYEEMEKATPPGALPPKYWRERGYPYKPGESPRQRFDPEVQRGIPQSRVAQIVDRFILRYGGEES